MSSEIAYPSLYLKRGEDARLRAGHLWVFSNEVDVKRSPLTQFEPGDFCTIVDSFDKPLGVGYVNPSSLISARLVNRGIEHAIDRSLFVHKFKIALSLRERLFAEPFYRLVFGESDGVPGLIVTNPPYGERIGAEPGLPALYSELGVVLRERFNGWQAAVLTGNAPLARNLGVYAKRTHRFLNGTLECRLLRFELDAASAQRPAAEVRADWSARPGAQMFANRLRKNLQRYQPWALREQIECFRVYDADMPEYAFAIDLYGHDVPHVYVQEYAPPKTVAQESARERRREVLAVLPEVLGVPTSHVHSRVRKPQKGSEQYEKRENVAERHVVRENGLKFWVNFRDYLDTGLFLDHRIIRQRLREWARDADFLNLFCYTGSATVYAAAGGARSTTSVDLSNTYLDWAHENLLLNGFGGEAHELFRADCLQWLENQATWGARFDLIFVDPPTFSNSKRMEGVLDVQRDHVGMIRRSLQLLRPAGRLIFSTNYTRFKLDGDALADLEVEDLSAATMPKDFERNARIHRCFSIRRH